MGALPMGIFEDEEQAMLREKEERFKRTDSIMADLVSYINTGKATNFSPTVESGNHIILRLSTTSHMLNIICEGVDAFAVSDAADPQFAWAGLSKKMMARHVLEWLNKSRDPSPPQIPFDDLYGEIGEDASGDIV
jgi:hypothetical protein